MADDDVRPPRRRTLTVVPPYESSDEHEAEHEAASPRALTEKTRIALDLRTVVVSLMALGAAIAWGVRYAITVENRQDACDKVLGLTATKGDVETAVEKLRSELAAKPAPRMLVSCPREVLRGRGDVICPAMPVGSSK